MLQFEILQADCTAHERGCLCSHARRRTLPLDHHVMQAPIFMPLDTHTTVKGVMPRSLHDMGVQIILGITFHLSMRPWREFKGQFGGLHNFESVCREPLT